jgi:murein endopeptidase
MILLAACLAALLTAQTKVDGGSPLIEPGSLARDAGMPDAGPAILDGGAPEADGGALAADDERDDEDDGAPDDSEAESAEASASDGGTGALYTRDLSERELQRRWLLDLPSLGSISVGFADEGRMIGAQQMGEDPAWTRVRPDLAWGARETVESLAAAFRAVHAQYPDSVPARLNHIGSREGGYLRPHRSHQSGRDADIGLFYKNDVIPHGRSRRERYIDPARTWALVRALVTLCDVQVILVDRGIQKVLRKHALEAGEDAEWLERLFHGGKDGLVKHARRHRDHLHVRFFAPRSQELGRRIQPLLAQRPEQNLAVHRVRSGQTLGHIARSYGTSVQALMKANRMRRTLLRIGQRLLVPLRKPCTRCPLPPPVVVPARFLPPPAHAAADQHGR